MSTHIVHHKTAEVDSVNIFYREVGSTSLPTLLLMHGHLSSSHVFRHILVRLSEFFHVVAPDYPGFGNSDMPDSNTYTYTFENIANTMDNFTEKIGLTKFFVYLFDYSAPVGLMIACKHPERIAGFFSQSGNAYEEGLSPAFERLRAFWAKPEDPEALKLPTHMLSSDGIKGAYTLGVQDPSAVAPDSANLDIFYTYRPGAYDIQKALLLDYEANVKKYPEWQAYLRKHKPKLVAVWGKNDPFFIPPGAEAFKRDVPDADVSIIDAGHFVMETNQEEIINGLKRLLK